MGSGGLSGEIYRPLSEAQVSTIHERALDLIEECGMTYEQDLYDVLILLKEAGCTINEPEKRIYFPRQLVKKLVATPESKPPENLRYIAETVRIIWN